jgi:hypothetical protein
MHTCPSDPKVTQAPVFLDISSALACCAGNPHNSLVYDIRRNARPVWGIPIAPRMLRIEATRCRQLPYFAPHGIQLSPSGKKAKRQERSSNSTTANRGVGERPTTHRQPHRGSEWLDHRMEAACHDPLSRARRSFASRILHDSRLPT